MNPATRPPQLRKVNASWARSSQMPASSARPATRFASASLWNIHTTPRQMARRGDPMAGLLTEAIDVAGVLEGVSARLEAFEAEEEV